MGSARAGDGGRRYDAALAPALAAAFAAGGEIAAGGEMGRRIHDIDWPTLPLGAPSEHLDDLVTARCDRVARQPRRADVAILAREATELNHLALRVPADPTRLSILRKRLEDFLSAHRVSESDLFDLIVAASEATANAIEHPVNPRENVIDVEVSIDDETVEATVRDTGRWRQPTPGRNRGRGLALIGALADLRVDHSDAGTTVRFRRRLRR
jgi:anti-sigma regulatory factor (Ser/Thr protein kinase)